VLRYGGSKHRTCPLKTLYKLSKSRALFETPCIRFVHEPSLSLVGKRRFPRRIGASSWRMSWNTHGNYRCENLNFFILLSRLFYKPPSFRTCRKVIVWTVLSLPCNPEEANRACCLHHASSLIGLTFELEDRREMFLRHVCWLSHDHKTLLPRSRCENHKS
jgi:hypothetical protein